MKRCCLAVFGASLALVAAPLAIPEGGERVLPPGGMERFQLSGRFAKDAEVSLVAVAEQPFAQALRLRTLARPESPWLMQAQSRNLLPLRRGDVCLAVFWARAVETSDEMGEGTLGVVFERRGAPHTKSLAVAVKLNREWRQFAYPFTLREAYEPEAAQCNLVIGYLPQTIEVAEFEILHFGNRLALEDLPRQGSKVTYGGREPDAPWRRLAAERIERYRKGDLEVVVRDRDGNPVANAEVRVAMQRHAYPFGAAVTARMLTADGEDARRYRAIVEENFNTVVLENDLKYGPWTLGKTTARDHNYNLDNTLEALAWLKERRIRTRGHCLLWGPLDQRHYPPARGFDFDAEDPEPNRRLILDHIDGILAKTDGFIAEWDVVNHPVATWGDRGRCWTDLFGREFYAELYQRARRANPDLRLYINEGSDFPGDNDVVRQRYEDIIAWLIEAGAPVEGIGFMAHFGASSLASMDFVYAHLERHAKFNLPLLATELDVSTDGDEDAQAEYYRDFITMFFSHPQTEGVVMWGFWEGRHWHPDRALWRRNWDIKPCGQAWLDLVRREWWTDAAGRTDAQGRFRVRGFLGEYRVEVAVGDRVQTLAAELARPGTECPVRLP